MAVVIISCPVEEARAAVARKVADTLGCGCLSREELIEAAHDAGIPVGKMEVAILKRSAGHERLARHKWRYLAFATSAICARLGQEQSLVYHGRAGHLLLPGVKHVLRVRVVPNEDQAIERIALTRGLSPEQAREYYRRLVDDVAEWVHFIHGVQMDDPGQYDLVINLERMGLDSATQTIVSTASLAEFAPTPESLAAMDDICLGARARYLLGVDERTAAANLTVSVSGGRVVVTYPPADAAVAEHIPRVLEGLEGAREIVCTMAHTTILWVAERFDPTAETFSHVVEVARRWGASVELMRLIVPAEEGPVPSPPAPPSTGAALVDRAKTGGIEEDTAVTPSDDGGLGATSEQLIHMGLFGGASVVVGQARELVEALNPEAHYSLVVIGEIALAKGPAARMRLRREVAGRVAELTRLPVITSDLLEEKFMFGPRQLVRMVGYLGGAAALYAAVFTHQQQVLSFIAQPSSTTMHVLATLGVALFVPTIAYLYGGATGLLLKWLKFE